MPNSPSRKETNKTGLIQARGDDDAHARAERELLELKDFAGSQMIALDGELTDDANTNALHWWKKWGSKFPTSAQLARRYLETFLGGRSCGYSEDKQTCPFNCLVTGFPARSSADQPRARG